jgi:pimeloyl-ACP methyl ester carboxylesterase
LFRAVTRTAGADLVGEALSVNVLGLEVDVRKGGAGPAVVVLHRDTGRAGWTAFHAALAGSFTVYAPSLPGFDASTRPDWMRTVSELATVSGLVVEALGVGATPVVGLGFGGWVAAEAAVQSPGRFPALVLHAPVGLHPAAGEILDQFLYSTVDYLRLGFADPGRVQALYGEQPSEDTLRLWDWNREMTTRLAWKPYMFSRALPHLLGAVAAPALIIRSGVDQIVPPAVADRYTELIPGARLAELPAAGHQADLEFPTELAGLVREFLRQA